MALKNCISTQSQFLVSLRPVVIYIRFFDNHTFYKSIIEPFFYYNFLYCTVHWVRSIVVWLGGRHFIVLMKDERNDQFVLLKSVFLKILSFYYMYMYRWSVLLLAKLEETIFKNIYIIHMLRMIQSLLTYCWVIKKNIETPSGKQVSEKGGWQNKIL